MSRSVTHGECCDLMYRKRFSPWHNWAVYKSYVRLAILFGREAWSLIESKMGICKVQRDL